MCRAHLPPREAIKIEVKKGKVCPAIQTKKGSIEFINYLR